MSAPLTAGALAGLADPQDALSRLAAMVDEKTGVARQASPGLTEVRQLLFAAILLAAREGELPRMVL